MVDLHGYLPLILKGTLLTVEVAVLSLLIAILLGLIGAAAKLSDRGSPSRSPGSTRRDPRRAGSGAHDPVFFGGQMLVNEIGDRLGWDYVDVSPFVAGVLTIGFIFGAYLTETFRGGIMAVSGGRSRRDTRTA